MRFSLVHKLASYLMAVAAFTATALSGELLPILTWGVAALVPLSWLWEPQRDRARRWEALWNVGTAVCFLWVLLDFLRPDGTLLSSGVTLLVFLLVNKLFNRRTSKDYLQLYVISFLLLVAATTLNTELSYALCFLAYVVFATWALTLFHLRREMEENYLLKHSGDAQSEKVEVERILNSRRIVGGTFLVGTSGVSLLVFGGALLIFFLFPRVGMGFFFARQRHGQTLSGFSERVDLGMHGAIKNNPAVVMRIEFPGKSAEQVRSLHLRGIAFDHYSLGGQWVHTHGARWRLRPGAQGLAAPSAKNGERGELEQRVYLEPLNSRVLFGATRIVGVQLGDVPTFEPSRVGVLGGEEDEIYSSVDRPAGFKYTVWSSLHAPPEADLAQIPDAAPPPEMSRYLQLPPGLSRRVIDLARRITAGKSGPLAKARAVREYLSHYRYTTDLPPVHGNDPLDEFLFVSRAGHCEYYATAMAILLRAARIPTREVNGFFGGEWNEYGHYLAVRQMDAHAWVEVWFDGPGWVTFDPTPAAGATMAPRTGFVQKLRQMVDSIELAWYKHMVEYNLDQQVEFARGVQRFTSRLTLRDFAGLLRAIGMLAIAAVALLLARRRRTHAGSGPRPRPARKSDQPVVQLYRRVLRRCARFGAERASSQTPREFAHMLAERRFPGAAVVEAATILYYDARFGGRTPSAAELHAVAEKLDQIGRPP